MTHSTMFALALLALFSVSAAPAPTFSKADSLFEKQLYDEALKEYLALAAKSQGDNQRKALYRAAEAEALLFRYGEAVKRVFHEPAPESGLWHLRWLVLRAELSRQFLRQYGHASPTDREEGSKDVTRKTKEEWQAEIDRAYTALWKHRELAKGTPLTRESYFVQTDKTDLERVPTLWDFVALRWTEYLLQEKSQGEDLPPADDFLAERSPSRIDSALAAVKAAAIYEDSAGGAEHGRATAKELWKIERLRLALNAAHVDTPADAEAFTRRAIDRFVAVAKSLRSARARAELGSDTAALYVKAEQFEDAVSLCQKVEKEGKNTPAAERCYSLRQGIQMPQLALTGKPTGPQVGGGLKVTARNLDEIHFRLYETTPELLVKRRANRSGDSWGPLRWLSDDLIREVVQRTPSKSWKVRVSYPKRHAPADRDVSETPKMKKGLYIALASSDAEFLPGKSILQGIVFNVTDLVIFGTAGLSEDPGVVAPDSEKTGKGFHIYVANAQAGDPVERATLAAYWTHRPDALEEKTDEIGSAHFDVKYGKRRPSNLLDVLASSNGAYAYLSSPLYLNPHFPERLSLYVETDRPIYRPTNHVRMKVTVLKRVNGGYEVYRGSSKIGLTVRDAGGQSFHDSKLALNDFGSAKADVVIPTGRLIGNYSIQATIKDGGENFAGAANFAVEEYKRPEFELTLADAEDAWKYGKTAKVKGTAKYYFGGAVPKAPIKYRVFRELYRPWFCWWWSPHSFLEARKEVAHGETVTNAAGEFQLSFEPLAPKKSRDTYEKSPLPSRFTVEIEGRDAGGRTLKAERAYFASAQAHLFDVQFPGAFAEADKPAPLAVRAVNYNEKPVSATGKFEIYRLEKPGPLPEGEADGNPSLQHLFEKAPNGSRVADGTFKTTTDAKTTVSLPALPAGVYRLVVKGPDAWGETVEQAMVFLAVDKTKARAQFPLPSISLAEKAETLPGETALVLLGSSDLTGKMYVETWRGPILEKAEVVDGGIHLKSFPVEARHKGGVTFRWFGARDYQIRRGEIHLGVPYADKEAKVALKLKKAAAPGEKVAWELSALDAKGRGIDGEATIRVYDRSLEYYRAKHGEWSETLYGPSPFPAAMQDSKFVAHGSGVYVEQGILEKQFGLGEPAANVSYLDLPRLRSQGSQHWRSKARYGTLGYGGGLKRMMAPSAEANLDMAVAAEGSAPDTKETEKESQPAPRAQFADTAYFDPQVRLKSGKGRVSFPFPDQLTSWRVVASVLTEDTVHGTVADEVVTKKDFMVRAEIPRFFRERDKGTLKAVLHNETDRKVSGRVSLAITDEKNAAVAWDLKQLSQEFSIEPHGTTAVRWEASLPEGTGSYKVRVSAAAGNLKDGEERDLPVLPSRQRVVASQVVALDGTQSKDLPLPRLTEKDTIEQTTLQIDPQLVLSVMNSLPHLVRYPYENTESVLNHYVPLAIMNRLYRQQPAIREAVKNIPKRKTVTPAWDRDDPRRLLTMMETPWEADSQGREAGGELVDLFDTKLVEKEKASSLEKLSAYQRPSGAFPWCAGGEDDPFMTLYVLAGFQQARSFGVEVPERLIKPAFEYVLRDMPARMKPETSSVSLLLYAGYVLSSYFDDYAWAKAATPTVKSWVDFADKHSQAMTVLGKAYATHVYHRLNEREKAQAYLDRALDGSREDEIIGVYWTPEKMSWLWYSDTLETHAMLLRTLVQFRPADKRVPGVAKWLLFHRKGNEWDSTKASAAAIYALVDFMKNRGALDKPETYQVKWDTTKEEVSLSPTDWLAKPLRWVKEGNGERSPATVAKKGPGIGYASLTTIFASDNPPAPPEGNLLNVQRKLFLRTRDGESFRLRPLKSGERVKVGDTVEVQLVLNSRSQFEYVHVRSPKGAGFEAEQLTSGWKWEQLSRYEEPRDSLSNFFVPWIPHGEYVLSYRLRATTAGTYRFGPAVAQSQYAPDMANYSAGFELTVTE